MKVAQSDSTEWKLLMLFLSNDKQDELHEEGARVMRDINSRIDEKSIEYMGLEVTQQTFFGSMSLPVRNILWLLFTVSSIVCLFLFMMKCFVLKFRGKDWILSSLAIVYFFLVCVMDIGMDSFLSE